MKPSVLLAVVALSSLLPGHARAQRGSLGYYRFPALHGNTLVFTAEGDLWKVSAKGGLAQRLTTHLETETRAEISPDGKRIAFAASYEGPGEIYTMPVAGGRPVRRTFEGYSGSRSPYPVGWRSNAELLYATRFFARRDPFQLAVANLGTGRQIVLPLEEASDGVVDPETGALVFTRLPEQRSHAKRYTGGLIENLWRYEPDADEAVPLTGDFEGTSRSPMLWEGRIYFVSDRDGTMNLWSMAAAGDDLKQHTEFKDWDVLAPCLHRGRVAFQKGADLWLYDIEAEASRRVPIRLASDLDQTRERWIEDPLDHLEDFAVSQDGSRIALTVRGQVFVAPTKPGRLVTIPRPGKARYRSAAFLRGGKENPESVYLLSDQTGETEFWSFPRDGVGAGKQMTKGASVLRYNGLPSPDGRRVAYTDRNQVLWILEVETGRSRKIWQSRRGYEFDRPDLSWSPDGRWLAFSDHDTNLSERVYLHEAEGGEGALPVTTDRFDSYSPTWGAGGKWLYFLSDRTFRSVQSSPWGPRQPEAYLDRTTGVYALDLVGGQRSPFAPDDELTPSKKKPEKKPEEEGKPDEAKPMTVSIEFEGLKARLHQVPIEAGNYRGLLANKSHLFLARSPLDLERKRHLISFPITRDKARHKWTTVFAEASAYDLSGNGSTLVVRKKGELFALPANGKPVESLSKVKIDLSDIALKVSPREEWNQMFVDAWRLHRDHFYDPAMHQVDWKAMRERHEALLPRVSDRWELDDLLGQMIGELSAMHTNIYSGDVRDGTEGSSMSYLGARLARVKKGGGYRIEHIYQTDPDLPGSLAPLARPGVDIRVGDILTAIDGKPTGKVSDPAILLQNKAGDQVLLETRRPENPKPRRSLVRPLSNSGFRNLKLSEWEYTRRLETEEKSRGKIGYLHMRAMSGSNYAEFVKGYYPVFDRPGLIIDMRQNYGGNIDSWILGRLTRKAWMYWKTRTGRPAANMQYAFHGHMVVLVDAFTISDGEAFAEGFRSLGLGPLIGTQTWGGGIWLRSTNDLVDGGLARSPETGVYSPDRQWIIEGEGVRPDLEVDNLPHATFKGRDAQLEAAISYLKKRIKEEPRGIPDPPPYPDKSFNEKKE